MKELAVLNKNLKKTNVRLKEVLALKDEFLHITSHQLRTPLTAIRGMLSMWVDGDYDRLPPKEKDEMIRRIFASADRLNNITNEMLDAQELEGGLFEMEFKKISLMEMIDNAISTLRPNYERKGLYLRLGKVDKNIPEIEAEPNYMSQVFLNLIDNACKYTRTGGTEIEVRNSGKFVDVYIRDTGIGMDKKVIKKAYEKFTRGENAVRENASGSGLGLFIAKKVLDAHNGKIAVHSAGPDKGTTFKVSLLIRQKQIYDRGKNEDIAKGDKQ
jgi:two-component system phosphate regulon sensor histidine kinase PhoR